jgi:hypothetical protein
MIPQEIALNRSLESMQNLIWAHLRQTFLVSPHVWRSTSKSRASVLAVAVSIFNSIESSSMVVEKCHSNVVVISFIPIQLKYAPPSLAK